MDKSNLVFLDTETTGIGAEDRLCQVAYKFKGKEFDAFFKPPLPISVEAMAVSHVTNKMVADREIFINSEMINELKNIFKADNILVAHNAQFDVEMLKKEGLEIGQMIDTFKLAHFLDKEGNIPKYNLQYLRYYFDFEVPDAQAHNALGDIRVLEVIFDYYFAKMVEEFKDETMVLLKMLEISSQPILIKKFNFGKYKGEKISVVFERDANYLKWLLREKNKAKESGEEDDKDWIYTLRHHLGEKPTLF